MNNSKKIQHLLVGIFFLSVFGLALAYPLVWIIGIPLSLLPWSKLLK
jgi:hypothetical protein